MLPFDPADDAFGVCPPIWLHANCEPFVVQQMKYRGWPQDVIDTWFRDWRDDEPNSEKEDEWMETGIAPLSHIRFSYPVGVFTAATHNRSILFVYKFIASPYHSTYGSVHSMHRVRYQPVGVTGIWIGGRVGVAPPRHHPVDTVEAATSSDGAVPSRGSAASPSGRAASPSGRAASPIDQQLQRVRVTTRAGAINQTSDSTPVHRDPETDTDDDI